ncbi:MAG TPA: LTA synthase family protein [Candidatus Coprovivens excrementavium]|nr:LTA synthase family protein [Candidatus Coprovivens excrementavium]
MKRKIINFFKKTRKKISKYLSTNRLFLTFVLFSLIETIIIRNYTIRNVFDYKPLICDFALLIIIGAFGYFIKPKKQFNYYFIWLLIITLMCIINSVYYVFYTSFASFSLIAELGLVGEVGDSVVEKFRVIDFIYVIFPVLFYLVHTKLKRGSYYHFVTKIEKSKKMFVSTILAGVIILAFTLVNITGTDASRLVKQWNREYIVQRFGIILYQGNDLIQSLTPKINSLFGYDEAAKEFKDFYSKKFSEEQHKDNKYTGVLEGMNVVFIHMESIQNFLVNMQVNGVEVTPTINKLSKEGMYFSNFFPQISIGTSSDTEFTLNTSLMPASSGTVFVQYYDRDYVSIPKLLKEKGYYTFSAHANGSSMWNRNNMHPSLGYDDMYFQDFFVYNEKTDRLGLGMKDTMFFEQMQPVLEELEKNNTSYMGTLIQLSNHSPFSATDWNPQLYDELGSLDLTNTYTTIDEETGEEVQITDDYLKGTKLGNYLISAHYADLALGTFIDYVNNSEYYDNTIFVLYGDHDAKLDKAEYQYYFNYNIETGELYEEGDPEYVNYDNFANEINRKTPLIIWTKNKNVAKKIKRVNDNVMGMYDVMPTLGNMMNFDYKYALGHDIYDIGENNVVIFPNGNFVTNKVYYNNSSGNYMIIGNDSGDVATNSVVIEEDYITNLKNYAEERLIVSNDIIIHDLIAKEGNNIPIIEESGES